MGDGILQENSEHDLRYNSGIAESWRRCESIELLNILHSMCVNYELSGQSGKAVVPTN